MTLSEFQEKYPSKWERIAVAKDLSDEQLDEIINSADTVQGKNFYSRLKKKNQIIRYSSKYNLLTNKITKYFLSSADNNLVYSPFSVLMLLSIMADSVNGNTRQEILDAIGTDMSYEDYREMISEIQHLFTEEITDDHDHWEWSHGGSVVSSNAVCVKESIGSSITEGYEDRLAKYQGKLFSSKNMIEDVNTWVKEKTKGMITNVAENSMKDMLVCFLNAISFEVSWSEPYEDEDILEGNFTNSDGSVSKVQMQCSIENAYFENEYIMAFSKVYADWDFSYIAILPKQSGFEYLKECAIQLDFSEILKDMDHENYSANIKMPEFKYDFENDITNLCKKMGISTLFSQQADFSPMTSERLEVGGIFHKAHIELDRNVTKAAAVSVGVAAGCAPKEIRDVNITFDRPFIYAIMHNETKLPVFVGIVNEIRE